MFIFCGCSLEPEEGEAQLASLGQAGLSIDPISPDELPAGLRPREDGTLRTLPGQVEGGLDGFFIPTMRRQGSDRQSVVSGKCVSVRVDLGSRRIIKNKKI